MKKILFLLLFSIIMLTGCHNYINSCEDFNLEECSSNDSCYPTFGSSGRYTTDYLYKGCQKIPEEFLAEKTVDKQLCEKSEGVFNWNTAFGLNGLYCDCNPNSTDSPYANPKFDLELYNIYHKNHKHFIVEEGCVSLDEMCRIVGGLWEDSIIINNKTLENKTYDDCGLIHANRWRQDPPGVGNAEIWLNNQCYQIQFKPDWPRCIVNNQPVVFSKEFYLRYNT